MKMTANICRHSKPESRIAKLNKRRVFWRLAAASVADCSMIGRVVVRMGGGRIDGRVRGGGGLLAMLLGTALNPDDP